MRLFKQYTALLSVVAITAFVPVTSAHAATYFYHTDHLGTPQVLTDANQTVVWKGDYDPFGKVTETVATVEQNLRFPGQYLDRESGLHYNYFRTYDPSISRYTQSDPIGLGGGINTYAYVGGNPLSYVDQWGLARFGFRELDGLSLLYTSPNGGMNHHAAHEQLWFDDIPGDNIGFFGGDGIGLLAICGENGDVRSDSGFSRNDYEFIGPVYDDTLMRQALGNIRADWDNNTYCLVGRNCQHFSDALRYEYDKLANPRNCRITSRGLRCT